MAEGRENRFNDQTYDAKESKDLKQLKRDLEGWREVMLPLNKVLHWDKPQHPAVIVGIVTFTFLMIWYFEPSVLTTFSLFGMLLCLADYLVPTIVVKLCSTDSWTAIQERQYEQICSRLLHLKTHVGNMNTSLTNMKSTRPKVYYSVMISTLALMAWIGSLVDNLLLTYLTVCLLVLTPGLRHHGIMQKYTNMALKVFQDLLKGKQKKT